MRGTGESIQIVAIATSTIRVAWRLDSVVLRLFIGNDLKILDIVVRPLAAFDRA